MLIGKEERRKAILEAAARLFAERGYHETKMDDVAELAGLSKGAIYLYYPSKEELFCALMQEKVEQMVPPLREAIEASRSVEELVGNIVRTQLQQRQENVDLFRIFQAEQPRADLGVQRSLEFIRERLQEFIAMLAGGFAKFLPTLDEQEYRAFALELIGMMNMHTMDWLFQKDPRPLVDRAETIQRHFLYGALSGLGSSGANPSS